MLVIFRYQVESDDKYTVDFYILKPTHIALSLHQDWLKNYGDTLLTDAQFTYSDVDFENIAKGVQIKR